MRFTILVCAAAAIGLASNVYSQSRDPETSSNPEGRATSFQEGKATRQSRAARSQRAVAVQDAARLTIESNIAFDRGDIEAGRTLARQAVQKIESAEETLTRPEDARALSNLSALRGRLLADFADDMEAAKRAFEDSIQAADHPEAQRRLLELLDREARASGGSVTESPRN